MKTKTYIPLILIVGASIFLSGCTKKDTELQPTNTISQIAFQKQINVNEEITVQFPIKDNDQTSLGQLSFIVKEIGEKNHIGTTNPIAGQTFYYVIFDVKGVSNNISSDSTQPQLLLDPSSPQIVMLSDTTLASIGGSVGGAFNTDFTTEQGLDPYELTKTNQTEWLHTATTWYTTRVEKPTMAIQYNDLAGTKQYIKINY